MSFKPIWERAVTVPPPVFAESPLDQITFLLNPVDYTLPEEYQDPAEYNSKVLRLLVETYYRKYPHAVVTLASGELTPLESLRNRVLYPVTLELGDGILDSSINVNTQGQDDNEIALAMIAQAKSPSSFFQNKQAIEIRIMTFAGITEGKMPTRSIAQLITDELELIKLPLGVEVSCVPELAQAMQEYLYKDNNPKHPKPLVMRQMIPTITKHMPSRVVPLMVNLLSTVYEKL